jgi:hypothetical protein
MSQKKGQKKERFTIDPLEGESAVEQFARDLFGSDTTVGIRDDGELLVYCHEQMARTIIEGLEGVL